MASGYLWLYTTLPGLANFAFRQDSLHLLWMDPVAGGPTSTNTHYLGLRDNIPGDARILLGHLVTYLSCSLTTSGSVSLSMDLFSSVWATACLR
jgi:hypothetical protein